MKGSEIIANVLKAEGVEFLTCFPHSSVIDSGAGVGIRSVVARTERVAVNIADGFSRMTGGRKIGVCAVQFGPGAENSFGAVAQAYSDSTPILHLAGGYRRHYVGVAPNFETARNFKGITKWAETVIDINRVPQMMHNAFSVLRSASRGPVLLEVPRDLMDAEIPDAAFHYVPPRLSRSSGDPQDVREAVDVLLSAKCPAIVVGQGVLYAEAWDELRELAELTQIPVMSTLNGKSAFPENHPLALGTAGASRPKMVDHFLAKTDLLFGIGTSFTNNDYITPFPSGTTMVQVTCDGHDVGRDYPISFGVIGDAKLVLAQMVAEVRQKLGAEGRRGDDAVAREVKAVRDEFLEAWMPRLTADDEPISPYRVIWDVMNTVDRTKTVFTHDAGNPRDQTAPFYEAIVPHGYMGWGKTTQLGTSMGLMMGAKLARPDWLAVNIMGDAAFGMVGMDFETAVRCNIPIITIVLNNGLMGGYARDLPIAAERYQFHRLSGDYRKLGEALGGYTERVERPADLKPALRRAIEQTKAGRAVLLDVVTGEEPNFPKG